MKITVIGINYAPELTGIGPYTTDMCEYLSKEGHDINVVCSFPYYPDWEIQGEYKGKIFLDECVNGISVSRCYVYARKNIGPKLRILHELSFVVSSFFRMLFSKKPDLYFVVSPPLGLGISTYIVSRLKRVPFFFHIQDLQPDAAVSLGMLPENGFVEVLYRIEKFIYRKAKIVSTISSTMSSRVLSKGVPTNKLFFFRNWITMGNELVTAEGKEFRKEFGLEGKFVFLYSGNIGKKQGLEYLIDAAAGISQEDIVIIIAGNGAHISQLKAKVETQNVGNVQFLPLQPKGKLPNMLAAADVCLVIQKRMMSEIVFPSKMLNIMAAGKPVLVTANSIAEMSRVVSDADCGFVAEPENVDSLREAILSAYHSSRLGVMGKNAAKYAYENFAKERILSDLNQLLAEIVSK